MITKSHLCLLAGGVALLTLVTGMAASAGEAKPLRVGVSPDYPPVVYKQGDDIFGFEADNAQGVAEALERPLQFVEMPFAELIPALREERIDVIMSGMTATDERGKLVKFTRPYVTVNLGILVRKADRDKYANAAALRKAEVVFGSQEGSTGAEYARVYCWGKKGLKFLNVADVPAALEDGTIDVYLRDTPAVQWIQSLNTDTLACLDFGLEPQPLAWAVRNADRGLHKQLDKLVKQWTKSGRLAETTARWLPGHDSSAAAAAGLRSAIIVSAIRPDGSDAASASIVIDESAKRSTSLSAPKWEVFYVDPGEHSLAVAADGLETSKQKVTVGAGQVVWKQVKLAK